MTKKKVLKVSYSATFPSHHNRNVMLWVAKPGESVHDAISDFEIHPNPSRTYSSKGNTVMQLNFNTAITTEIKFQFITTLSCTSSNNCSNENLHEDDDGFLDEEPHLERPEWLQTTMVQICKNSRTPQEIAYAIFCFVINHMEYQQTGFRRGVKNMDPHRLVGDCGEYATLFVSMCRTAGIPARNETGFVVFPGTLSITEHAWAQVRIDSTGWKDVDPQFAQIAQTEGKDPKQYFLARPDHRITFTHGLNITLRPEIPPSFKWQYWEHENLPASKDDVEVLQPLFFASDGPIGFHVSIKMENR